MKVCIKCNLPKDESEFHFKNDRKKLSNDCKNCFKEKHSARQKKYAENNKEKIAAKDKKYYAENKEQIAAKKKDYSDNNKEIRNQRDRNRSKDDILYKLRNYASKSIRVMLKSNGVSKNGYSIMEYLPYSFAELKQHLESQFEPWMTWKNRGIYNKDIWNDNDQSTWTWQIDHIIPHSAFKYTDMECIEFQECWALENLRPLSAKENIIKGNRKVI